MPAVLDCDDRSPQLRRISEAFDRFLHDIHQCRGVLSSRPFRQPVAVRGRRLTIRPFTEAQIRQVMKIGYVAGSLMQKRLSAICSFSDPS